MKKSAANGKEHKTGKVHNTGARVVEAKDNLAVEMAPEAESESHHGSQVAETRFTSPQDAAESSHEPETPQIPDKKEETAKLIAEESDSACESPAHKSTENTTGTLDNAQMVKEESDSDAVVGGINRHARYSDRFKAAAGENAQPLLEQSENQAATTDNNNTDAENVDKHSTGVKNSEAAEVKGTEVVQRGKSDQPRVIIVQKRPASIRCQVLYIYT